VISTNDGRRKILGQQARDGTTHAGLWLDKYLAELRAPDAEKSDGASKAIRTLMEEAASTHVPEGYEAAFARRRAALEALDGGVDGGSTRVFVAEASGRLVVGLGTSAIRETNVALLHTWGVPYLPGSALKGLASAAAHGFAGDATWEKAREERTQGEDHALLFGDTKRAGCVVFHDAWWVPEGPSLPLDLDVMTVHHPDYYRDGKSAPADWDEPTPVAFLTTRGRYLVALSGPEAWVLRAGEWLALGLEQLGVGAKTQAGYGRMALSRARSQGEIEEAALREKHKATLDALANLPAQHKGASTARQHVEKLRAALAAGAPAAHVYAIARSLYRRDGHFWRGWLKDARRTDEERAFVEESGMFEGEPRKRTMKRRVLVASVGGSAEPIVNAIVKMQPDFVYFLCSTGKAGSDAVVEKTIVPGAKRAEGSYTIEQIKLPDDMNDVTAVCQKIQNDLAKRFPGEDIDVVADYTGGTRTMGGGLVAFAVNAKWRLQVADKVEPPPWIGRVTKLTLDSVTVFSKCEVSWSPGINVIIGENGTGKTHILKCMYALLRATEDADTRSLVNDRGDKLERVLAGEVQSLLAVEAEPSRVKVACDHAQVERTQGIGVPASWTLPRGVRVRALFLPSREVLAMYRGFGKAYDEVRLSFDETYYDLCGELGREELREAPPNLSAVLEELEGIIGGPVRLALNSFVVDTKFGKIAAPMIAEGHRKLASLAYLIKTGALTNESVLFWDEPEANLNPKLVTMVARAIRKLASAGVQIFVATHDYLMARELSMAAQYRTVPVVDTRFFALHRAGGDGPVEVESVDNWSHLEHNAIVEEYAAHYDREQDLFAGGSPGEQS
jgi:CRISPR type III-B/RAMP module RAMP protein Cmr6